MPLGEIFESCIPPVRTLDKSRGGVSFSCKQLLWWQAIAIESIRKIFNAHDKDLSSSVTRVFVMALSVQVIPFCCNLIGVCEW